MGPSVMRLHLEPSGQDWGWDEPGVNPRQSEKEPEASGSKKAERGASRQSWRSRRRAVVTGDW